MQTAGGNTIHCRRCSRTIFTSMRVNYLWMDDKFAPRDDDYYRSGQVTICPQCTKKIRKAWLSPPVQRPPGWWKRIVDPNLKWWAKLKGHIFAPIMDIGPCDRCRQEEKLYRIRFPTCHDFGKDDIRYLCEECMSAFAKEFKD